MKGLAILALTLILMQVAQAQLVIDFTPPTIEQVTLRQTEQGIFCNAKTSDGSWPIFSWKANGRALSSKEPLLENGYSSGDNVECTVIATTGFLNATTSRSIVASSAATSPITGAITGAVIGTTQGGGSAGWLLVGVFAGLLAVLAYTNVRLFRKLRA